MRTHGCLSKHLPIYCMLVIHELESWLFDELETCGFLGPPKIGDFGGSTNLVSVSTQNTWKTDWWIFHSIFFKTPSFVLVIFLTNAIKITTLLAMFDQCRLALQQLLKHRVDLQPVDFVADPWAKMARFLGVMKWDPYYGGWNLMQIDGNFEGFLGKQSLFWVWCHMMTILPRGFNHEVFLIRETQKMVWFWWGGWGTGWILASTASTYTSWGWSTCTTGV